VNTSQKDLLQVTMNVTDERFLKLCEIFQPKSKKPATLTIVDVSGMGTGSTKEGLGNAFMAHMREVDALYHVLRAYEEENSDSNDSDVNPLRDIEIVAMDMVNKDKEIIERKFEELDKQIHKTKDKKDIREKEILMKVKEELEKKKWIKDCTWNNEEIEVLNDHMFLTAKPIIYLVNLSPEDYKRKKNKWLPKLVDWVKKNVDGPIVPFSAVLEDQLIAENPNSGTEFIPSPSKEEAKKVEKPVEPPKETKQETKQQTNQLEKKGQETEKPPQEEKKKDEKKEEKKEEKTKEEKKVEKKEEKTISAIPKLIKFGYKCLGLVPYFTVGPDECKAWTIREGWKAPQAAAVIHSDLEKAFIGVEVMKYDDFMRTRSVDVLKKEGKYRQHGKDYTVEDGDICEFKANAVKKSKK